MSAILDIVVVLIIGLSIFFAMKNGFIKTLVSFSCVIVAIIVVALFTSDLKAKLLDSSAARSVRNAVNEKLASIVSAKADDEYDPEEVVSEKSKFDELLDIVGIDSDEFEKTWNEWKTSKSDDLRDKLVNFIADPLMNGIATLISFIILFFGTIIVLKLAAFILDKIFALPVLKTANKLFGCLLGIALAWMRVSAFIYIVEKLLPYLQTKGIVLVSNIDPSKTIIFKWLENISLISLLFD